MNQNTKRRWLAALLGAAAGMATLLGLVLCWAVVVPWLMASSTLAEGQTLSALALQLWSSKARFLGAGVIGISALWTVVTLIRPILAAMAQQPVRAASSSPRTVHDATDHHGAPRAHDPRVARPPIRRSETPRTAAATWKWSALSSTTSARGRYWTRRPPRRARS